MPTAPLPFFIFALSSLFTLVNPVGIAPLYLGMTEHYDEHRKTVAARRGVLTAFALMVIFAITGNLIFKFFGITINAFRIAGGLLFFRIGLDMMQARLSRTKHSRKEDSEALTREDVGIIPLGVPVICGPGALTSTMILSGESDSLLTLGIVILAIIVTLIATYIVLRTAPKLSALLGNSGMRIISRIMGLIVMVIAVQFIIDGVKPILTEIIRNAVG
ncbi:MAG: hypothetical protein MAGBODY4_00915 [Candidatus Marinimicrobia bacterium]|nr:hypothetical protein [Candidatus Neomarinimicrobiota bacterium]